MENYKYVLGWGREKEGFSIEKVLGTTVFEGKECWEVDTQCSLPENQIVKVICNYMKAHGKESIECEGMTLKLEGGN